VNVLSYIFLIATSIFGTQNYWMEGKYRISFADNTIQKDGIITIKTNHYKMKVPKQKICEGIIKYGSTLSSFEYCNDNSIVIDFETKDMSNDTIEFEVHDKKIRVASYLHISINHGKMIRIK
jgi:hypothetical protein